jgi:hypothetical protein
MPSAFGKPVTTANRFGVAAGAAVKYAILSVTTSDTYSFATWTKKTIDEEIYDPDNIVSLTSSVFTLGAGTFLIHALNPVQWTGTGGDFYVVYQTRIRNTTASTNAIIGESNAMQPTTAGYAFDSVCTTIGTITLTTSATFEWQQYYSGNGTFRNGTTSGAGIGDRYGKILILQLL